jgi:2-succinyl-6-hydroxy-2,4-cyclohexadiene-1-carboxylate synthase
VTADEARGLAGDVRASEDRRVALAGVELNARVEALPGSDAPPVLILHGFTGSLESMTGVAQLFRGERGTACVDLLGHGASDAPDAAAHYSMESCVAQLCELIDVLALERPHLLGYSMGGRAALSLCVAHPDKVSSALLVGASAGLAGAAEREERRRSDDALAARILEEGLEAFVDHWMGLPLFASQVRMGQAQLASARAQRLQCRPQGLALSLRGMGSGAMPPLHAALPRASVPVCLVAGAEDAKFRAIAGELAAALPQGQAEVIPEAGHAAHLENPRAFGRVARHFFDEVDAKRAA